MDALFWAGNWQAVPESQYLKAPAALVRQQNWIIEGYIDETMAERLSFAELVIYLDYSGPRCAWRVFRRWLAHRNASRPELPNGTLETLSFEFLWTVLRRAERPGIENAIRVGDPSNLSHFRSPADALRANLI